MSLSFSRFFFLVSHNQKLLGCGPATWDNEQNNLAAFGESLLTSTSKAAIIFQKQYNSQLLEAFP